MSTTILAQRVPYTNDYLVRLLCSSGLPDSVWERYITTVTTYMTSSRRQVLLLTTRHFAELWYSEFEPLYRAVEDYFVYNEFAEFGMLDSGSSVRRLVMQTVVHLGGVHNNGLRRSAHRERRNFLRAASQAERDEINGMIASGAGTGNGARTRDEDGMFIEE